LSYSQNQRSLCGVPDAQGGSRTNKRVGEKKGQKGESTHLSLGIKGGAVSMNG